MNERARAIAILKQARDLLAERLTDDICHLHEEILEDALGMGYESTIDSLYDRVGMRLSHLNSMINNLPQEQQSTKNQASTFDLVHDSEGTLSTAYVQTDTSQAGAESEPTEPLIRPVMPTDTFQAPTVARPMLPAPTFQVFFQQVHAGEMGAAARSLSSLLEIKPARAKACVAQFEAELKHGPEVLLKALQLRSKLGQPSSPEAVALLKECFGMDGVEAGRVMQKLRGKKDSR